MSAEKISIPEWENIHMGNMSESDLFRHFMFLGETGSGKTISGVLPVCRLAFGSSPLSNQLRSAGLVVDPKGELGDYVAEMLGSDAENRLIRIRKGIESQVLWQFDGTSLEGRDGSSIMEEVMTFADSYQGQKSGSHERFWVDGSGHLIAAIIDIDLALFRHNNENSAANIHTFWRQFYFFMDGLSNGVNVAPLYEMIKSRNIDAVKLDEALTATGISLANPITYQKNNYLFHINHLVAASIYYGSEFIRPEIRKILKIISGNELYQSFWGFLVAFIEAYKINDQKVFERQEIFFRQYAHMADGTYSSFQAVFSSLVHEFLDHEFCNRVSINPFESPDNCLAVDNIIANGKIVVYEPGVVTTVTATVGKVLKASFFKKLLVAERLNNPSARPFFYLCDEFQRFITHDEESGEQSFLDRCRAYRVCCVLATQSLASLRYAFPDEKGGQAINILVTNTGTKMFFRTTDSSTADTLSHLIPEPHRQDRPHVVKVRPPSTLQPGECYYVLVNGASGRGQIRASAINFNATPF
jgi:hypothetical protein